MRRTFFLMCFGFGAMMIAATQTQAQTGNCADHAQVVERLAERYGESRQSIGLGSDNAVVEVFASMDTGSWTITVTRPGGPTCLVAAGQAYQYVNEPLANFDSQS
ncbi:MAG: hypothetical protein NWQ23_02135 [Yoonia sp.]|uniref:hypothetical protein n=1 Tax=Yoonia sp. TaxID=2212373 RepID=UPI00273FD61A|nr:hypothetical protein [Yoonia sp.]MDP5084190.1 hypothetical protein [Yoonia sp.]MDP5361912.1 hypothetical protein [Paracoccaceae bacterium]